MPGTAVVITSGKGGVGKTTSTANVGTALALMGHKVVVIDADIGLRNLDVVMGLENRIVYDLVNVVEGSCRLRQALIRDRRVEGLHLLPAAQTRDKTAVQPEQMKDLCDKLKEDFNYVIIDSPAGIEQGFRNAIAGADRAIIVTTPDVPAIQDADRVIGIIEAADMPSPWLIINRVQPKMVREGEMVNIQDIVELLAVRLLGFVPEGEDIVISTNEGKPVVHNERSRTGSAFRYIAARIDGQDIPLEPLDEDNGLLSRLKRLVKL